MKVLLCHNSYKESGGEDTELFSEMVMIKKNGVHVSLFSADNKSCINTIHDKVKTFLNVTYNTVTKKMMADKIMKFKPDVVHIHNFFPILTPSIYDPCIEMNIPVVQTLHNYRLICPGSSLVRNGKICEKCIGNTPFYAAFHRCYKKSFLGSLAVANMVSFHGKNKTWNKKVNRFIALTQFSKKKFVEAGFPENKIVVKPNLPFFNQTANNQISSDRNGALFVGRLSSEKGIITMLKSWEDLNIPLRIAGTGPLYGKINLKRNDHIVFTGKLKNEQVSMEMYKSCFLIMPSECFETFGLVITEAFAHQLPVITSRLGSMAEIVEDGVTGLHFEAGNPRDLAEKVLWMHNNPEACRKMGENARREYENKYTPERNYEMLMDIYHQAIEEKKRL